MSGLPIKEHIEGCENVSKNSPRILIYTQLAFLMMCRPIAHLVNMVSQNSQRELCKNILSGFLSTKSIWVMSGVVLAKDVVSCST